MSWARTAVAMLVGVMTCEAAHAQLGFPSRSLTLVVPYSAGSVADVGARLVADKLSETFKHQVVVENRPGAGGIPSAKQVLGAAPDGYTMLLAGNNNPIAEALFKALPYNIQTDFRPVSSIAFFDLVIITRAGSPLRTVADIIKAAQASKGLSLPVPKAAGFGVTRAEDQEWVDRRMTPHPFSTYQQKVVLQWPYANRVARTYIDCTNPASATLAATKARVRADREWKYVEIATGHDGGVTPLRTAAQACPRSARRPGTPCSVAGSKMSTSGNGS